MNETETTPKKLTVGDVAQRLNVTGNTVRNWALSGALVNGVRVPLECIHVGQGYRFTVEALERFLEHCRLAKLGQPFTAPESPDKERERMARETRDALAKW